MPSRQRIVFVANTSWSIYKFRLHIIQALVQKGCEVFVLAPRDNYTGHFEYLPGIFFIALKKLKSKSISVSDDVQLYRELLHHYRRLQPALFFHYTIKCNIYGSLAAARIGCSAISVVTGLGYMFTRKTLLTYPVSVLYRYALRQNREVWFLNHDDRHYFIEQGLVAAGRAFLLPGEGVDAERFYPAAYQYKEGPVNFLLIARLIAHKGIHEFAEAAAILQAKPAVAKCSLLGFFDNESAVAISNDQLTEWQKDNTVVYLGQTDNVVPFIADADCVVLPSYREGMPLSLLEAASMCKAIIATDVAGCRELVKEGRNGFLCKPKDAADLAAKMEQYCLLPPPEKQAMGTAGRELVLSNYTNEIIEAIYITKVDAFTQ